MKKLLLLLLPLWSIAQPSGRLYVSSTSMTSGVSSCFGYVDYPSGTYQHVDSINAHDFILHHDSIYATENDVYVYSAISNTLIDSFQISDAEKVAAWNDQLIVLGQNVPYLRVYDRFTHNLMYVINTDKMGNPSSDLVVSNDRGYVLLNDSVLIIDLIAQDTLAKMSTPHPFSFGGMNSHIIARHGLVYIDINYATGAARFSMTSIDESTLIYDTLFHYESAESFYKPVVAGDSICFYMFPSHYNLASSSLYVFGGFYATIEYDSINQNVFLRTLLGDSITYYKAGVFSSLVTIPGIFRKGIFRYSQSTAINSILGNHFNIYPNPADELLKIETDFSGKIKEIIITNTMGEIVLTDFSGEHQINIDGLTPGIYFVEVNLDKEYLTRKIIIQ